MARHAVYMQPGTLTQGVVGALVTPERSEAGHALRVKRVNVGELVTLLDGCGRLGVGAVVQARSELVIRVESVRDVPPAAPRVEVWSATPKGPRLEDMIDQLSQVGAALWRPLETEHGVVEPGENKIERCRRVARESAKQCGRAWVMEIGEAASFETALSPRPGVRVVVADAYGARWERLAPGAACTGDDAPCVRVLVGPEGGFSSGELKRAEAAGAPSLCLGPHVLRIETAAVCAAARIVGG